MSDLEELIRSTKPVPGISPDWGLLMVQNFKILGDNEIVEIARAAISELGWRIQGTGKDDKTITEEGHLDGMKKVAELLLESTEGMYD